MPIKSAYFNRYLFKKPIFEFQTVFNDANRRFSN